MTGTGGARSGADSVGGLGVAGLDVHADGRTITFSSRGCRVGVICQSDTSCPVTRGSAHLVGAAIVITWVSAAIDVAVATQVAEAFRIAEDPPSERANDAVLLWRAGEGAGERGLDVADGRLARERRLECERRRSLCRSRRQPDVHADSLIRLPASVRRVHGHIERRDEAVALVHKWGCRSASNRPLQRAILGLDSCLMM